MVKKACADTVITWRRYRSTAHPALMYMSTNLTKPTVYANLLRSSDVLLYATASYSAPVDIQYRLSALDYTAPAQ